MRDLHTNVADFECILIEEANVPPNQISMMFFALVRVPPAIGTVLAGGTRQDKKDCT